MKHIRTLIRTLVVASAALLATPPAAAIPVHPARVWLTLTDGTRIEATAFGDEHGHAFRTDDGRLILGDNQRGYTLATTAETQAWRTAVAQRQTAFNTQAVARSPRFRKANVPTVSPTTRELTGKRHDFDGERRGLIILANFTDRKMTYTIDDFHRMVNEKGYDLNGSIGCLNEYFYDQSYGKFDFEFDLVGPVELPRPSTFYGSSSSWGNDTYVHAMIAEACRQADKDVDFRTYDWDGDGEVEQVFVVYAGYGEHYQGNNPDYVWPQAGWLKGGSNNVTLDGVRINTFACSSELEGLESQNSKILSGLGVMAHEFSHCFGIPDMYYTDGMSSASTMESWDIMARGAYNGPMMSTRPCGFTAYERWLCGWLDFTDLDLSAPGHVDDLKPLNDTPVAYRITNPFNPNEYFIMENRRADRWYSYYSTAPSYDGVLLTHVNYNEWYWTNNYVNSATEGEHFSAVRAESATNFKAMLFCENTRTSWNGISHLSLGARYARPNGALGEAPDVVVEHITRGEDGTVSFDYDKLTHRYEVGNFLAVEVTKFDFAARANKRLKVRQPVDLTIKSTGADAFLDIISVGYALIPAGTDVEDYLAMPDEDLTHDSSETIVTIEPGEEYSTTAYFTPREKGLYYLEVRGKYSGVIDATVLAVGVDLPEGINGIRIDTPTTTTRKQLEDGRVLIINGAQRHNTAGQRM